MSLRLVIAARGGPSTKSRLAPRLTPVQRGALVEAMLADMLAAAAACPDIARVYVVTPTPELARMAARFGAVIALEPTPAGLGAAFEFALRHLPAEPPGSLVALLPGDLPRLAPEDLCALAAQGRADAALIAPSLTDGGTGCVLAPAGRMPPLAFGPGSFDRHMRAARAIGLNALTIHRPGLCFDLDRSEDLDRLAASATPGRAAGLARLFATTEGAAA
jgi:2-phospho-L-lactate guanylyltransferase